MIETSPTLQPRTDRPRNGHAPNLNFLRTSQLRTPTLLAVVLLAALLLLPGSAHGGSPPDRQIPHLSPFPLSTPAWVNLTGTAGGPSDRDRVAMVDDAADGYVLLFGGYNAANGWVFYNDTWTFSGGSWTEIFPSNAPSPRANAAIAYDPALHSVILFGGNAYGAQFNDTWSFAHGNWTQLHPLGAPSARFNPGFAFDNATNAMILFGGDFAPALNVDVGLGDTWSFNGTAWTNVTGSSAPSPRAYPAMSYDTTGHQVILFGGWNTSSNSDLNDTWSYANSSWSRLNLTAAPSERVAAAFSSSSGNGLVLFGGLGPAPANLLADTWLFAQDNWTTVGVSGSPSPRGFSGFADDPKDGYLVLFGGYTASQWNGETWGLTGSNAGIPIAVVTASPSVGTAPLNTTLTAAASGGQPPYKLASCPGDGSPCQNISSSWNGSVLSWNHSYLQPGRFVAAVKVTDSNGTVGSSTARITVGPAINVTGDWINITATAGGPSPRNRVSMAYDPAAGYVLLFGGYNAVNGWVFYNDTWSFSNGTWSELFPAQAPSVRANAAMVYDAALRAMVLFGGNAYGSQFNDTWTFSNGTWNQLITPSAPSPRFNPGMAYDSSTRQVVLFSGDYAPALNVDVGLGDTWTFNGTNWQNVTPLTGPSPRTYAAMSYDSVDGSIVLFGGWAPSTNSRLNDTWSFVNGSWTLISSQSSPPARSSSAVADVPGSGVLMFGGDGSNITFSDTWVYQGGSWNRLNTTNSPSARCCEGLASDAADNYAVLFGGRLDGLGAWVGDTWVIRLAPANGSGGGGNVSAKLSLNLATGPVLGLSANFSVTVFGGTAPYQLSLSNGAGGFDNLSGNLALGPVHWTVSYPAAGTYTAAATLSDAKGNWASAESTVSVGAIAALKVATSEETAVVSPAPTVTFVATIEGGVPPYSIQWSFGDGSYGSSQSGVFTQHTYLRAGTFTPRVSVSDGAGNLAAYSLQPIRVASQGGTNPGGPSTQLFGLSAGAFWTLVVGLSAVGAGAVITFVGIHRYRRRRDGSDSEESLVRALEFEAGGRAGK